MASRLTPTFAVYRSLFILLLIAGSAAATTHAPLTWRSTADIPRLTNEEVAALIDELEGYIPVRVESFEIVDVDGDGVAELVAAADSSGRGFYGRLFIIRGSGKPRYDIIQAWDVRDVGHRVADLDGDGRPEIVVTKLMTPYGGEYPQVTYSAVYARKGNAWSDASASFASWYREYELPRLEAELAERRRVGHGGEYDRMLVDAAEMERDKVLRIIGADREAGLATAATWANDAMAYRRIYAATVLGDIATPAARERLRPLLGDPEKRVAETARVMIERKGTLSTQH